MAKLASNPGCLASSSKFSVLSSEPSGDKGVSNGWNEMCKGPEARRCLVRLRKYWKASVAGAERAGV